MARLLAILSALSLALVLALARPAAAAPMCQNRQGDIVRCDAKEAMPIGWTVSPQAFTARVLSRTPAAGRREYLALAVVLVCFFSILALLPRFDGWQEDEWDRQEGE